MSAFTKCVATIFAMHSFVACAAETQDQILTAFDPLVSRVRGGIRYQLQQGKGCLPWAGLAKEGDVEKTYAPFGFTSEKVQTYLVEKFGDASGKSVGKLVAIAANNNKTVDISVIGTCEKDALINSQSGPNVIQLILERRNGLAIQLRYPFVQDSNSSASLEQRR